MGREKSVRCDVIESFKDQDRGLDYIFILGKLCSFNPFMGRRVFNISMTRFLVCYVLISFYTESKISFYHRKKHTDNPPRYPTTVCYLHQQQRQQLRNSIPETNTHLSDDAGRLTESLNCHQLRVHHGVIRNCPVEYCSRKGSNGFSR